MCLVAAISPGCVMSGHLGNLDASGVTNPVDQDTLDLSVERRSFAFGSVFDFRAARIVASLEMVTREPKVQLTNNQVLDPTTTGSRYEERRVLRLDVPALTLWEFREKRLGYPGLIPHRQSLDLWARAGTSDLQGDQGGFLGGALTYYHTGRVAISLTVDRWSEPSDIRALSASGTNRTFEDDVAGWVVGFEVTLAAGEYALDILDTLLGIDDDFQDNHRRMSSRRR